MKKRYFNRKIKQSAKSNLKRNGGRKKMLWKRMGGVLHASMIMENRNVNAAGMANQKKEIL